MVSVVFPLPTATKAPSGAKSRAWVLQQPYDVKQAATNPQTSENILMDIIANAPSRIVNLIGSNRGATERVLNTLFNTRGNHEIARKLVTNPNTPDELLNQILSSSYGGYAFIIFRVLLHPNASFSTVERILPKSAWVNLNRYPLAPTVLRFKEKSWLDYATFFSNPSVPIQYYFDNAWFLPLNAHLAVYKARGFEINDYVLAHTGNVVDPDFPITLVRYFRNNKPV